MCSFSRPKPPPLPPAPPAPPATEANASSTRLREKAPKSQTKTSSRVSYSKKEENRH